MGKSNLKEKVSTTWNNVVLHWKTPALGKYVSYKEIIAYGVGGMGVQFVMFFCSLIALSATSFLVGNTIGIKPMHLQYMAVASTIIGFGITIGRSYIIDSARFKSGKFRPWLAITGIPTVIIAVVFVWLPYETMSYMQKVIAVFLCYNLLQCFYPFFQQAYTDLANVISPNSHERTDIVSVSSIIYSMAPSLTGLFVPMLSTLTGGLNSITTYRIIHPLVAVAGLLLSYVAYAGTRERIIVAESHVTQFKFSGALCGVTGLLLVSGTDHTIATNTVGGRGFTAIMVSWLAKFNPAYMILTSLLIVFFQKGAIQISTSLGLNDSFADIITGIIIFFIIGSEFFINYSVKFRSKEAKA